eukprot:4232426-Karenia_brevis.AAC.1
MAILKRGITMIAGENGFYLRLPGESEKIRVHRFSDACLRKGGNWFKTDHAREYALHEKGVKREYE